MQRQRLRGGDNKMRVLTVRAALLGTAAGAALFATSANAQPNSGPAGAPTSGDTQASNNAQTQSQAATGSDQSITVTARRRNELLLNVPIAVSAYSGEQLNRQGALTITDVAKTTPNVTLKVSRGTNSTLTPFIRGIGQQDPAAGFEQGVGVYVDDVYLNRPQAAVLDIYDVDRIEVLRGPQGTFGCAASMPVLGNVYDTQGGLTDPTQRVRAGGVALHAEANITDTLKVRWIRAYRKDVGYTPIDFDATPFPDVDVPAIYRNK